MSDVVFPKNLQKARKEHVQTIDYCFDEMITRGPDKVRVVDEKIAKDVGLNWNEIQTLKNNWKIAKGEEYYTWSGIQDGLWWTVIVSVKIYEIITKYELWPEY